MGWMGKILRVDLTHGVISEEAVPTAVYEKYLSGIGLAAYYLTKEIPKNCDPMGPNNILGFVSGLLTGTGALFAGRWLAVCKSPLTGGWGDANCGGYFAPALKRCGYDAIFVKGKAKQPVYVYVKNGAASIEDADHLWGLDAIEAEERLIASYSGGRKPAVACIGTGGESLSLISGICHDKGRIAARSGVGAVMGSKKLKAIVVGGSKPIRPKYPDRLKEQTLRLSEQIKKQKVFFLPDRVLTWMGAIEPFIKNHQPINGMLTASVMKRWGTAAMTNMSLRNGDAPIKNWAGSPKEIAPDTYRALSPAAIESREVKKYHCYACPIGCGGICEITKDSGTNPQKLHTHKPEYETINSFGPLLLNSDVDSIFSINDKLNRAGLDTISVAGTIAFAIECYQTGLVSKDRFEGLELRWGDAEAIETLCDKIIRREGIGNLLADGVRAAVRNLGLASEDAAIHAGGQELPAHDGRRDPGYAVHYSVEPTPGRHTVGSFQYYVSFCLWKRIPSLPVLGKRTPKSDSFKPSAENARCLVACSAYKMVIDASGLCLFGALLGIDHLDTFALLEAAAGLGYTPEEYMIIGRRIQTLRQIFNLRQGLRATQNRQSDRASGQPPLRYGPNKGKTLRLNEMIRAYWTEIGWDEEGVPTSESLKQLGLEEFLDIGQEAGT
ncbi:MAG TPA: aldehyde ferredoxin oxidoreductase family protein [Thermotogota bacterium]|nr:aldehyde ferredoxin oxidoreductase family protein [Thermotogota bacterium]